MPGTGGDSRALFSSAENKPRRSGTSSETSSRERGGFWGLKCADESSPSAPTGADGSWGCAEGLGFHSLSPSRALLPRPSVVFCSQEHPGGLFCPVPRENKRTETKTAPE